MNLLEIKKPLPGDFCLLCNGEPSIIGVFIPDKSLKWGGLISKQRFFRYCLCSKCQKKPDAMERVEKVIRAELAGVYVNNEQ
jgi:hypothetical protein